MQGKSIDYAYNTEVYFYSWYHNKLHNSNNYNHC